MFKLSSSRILVGRWRDLNRVCALVIAGVAGAGLILSFGGAATASAARLKRIPVGGIVGLPGGGIKLPPGPTFPGVYSLQANPNSVTVRWYDRSTDEQKFIVYRRDQRGAWQDVDEVPTRDVPGTGGDYTYIDASRGLSGQCYMIEAVNVNGAGDTQEQCTVRPDPSQFPQDVSSAARQWFGLSRINDGTGNLQTSKRSSYTTLTHAHQTFGVDLDWSEHSTLWKIEAQGGPHVMYGQAIALRVWGGGWLTYSNQTWGVDVQLSSTPAYQWYVLGAQPGTPIDSQDFALWNSAANAYLVMGHETWGVDLKWYKPSTGGGSTVHSASVFMIAQPPVQGFVPFLGYFGGGSANHSVLTEISNSPYGATLFFIKPGHSSSQCGDPNAVITLPPAATMTSTQMQTLYGSATPSLSNTIPFLACAATNNSSVSVNVKYRDQ